MKSAICGNIHHAPIEDMLHNVQGHAERRNICEKDAADHILPGSFGACCLRGRNGTGSGTPPYHHLCSIGIANPAAVTAIANSDIDRAVANSEPDPDPYLYAYRYPHCYTAADRHAYPSTYRTYPCTNRDANVPATDTHANSHQHAHQRM
jgi:hypothetical protein